MAGRFSVGDRLPTENQLAQRFSVSRPVVREALQRLRPMASSSRAKAPAPTFNAAPRSGSPNSPASTSLHEVLQVMELRMALEELSAKLAARNRTDEQIRAIEHACRALGEVFGQGAAAKEADFAFHRAIAVASGNSVLVETWTCCRNASRAA